MVKKAGEKTGQFGLWLTEYIHENHSNQGYQVYYDHGDSRLHDNVAVIKGFLGDTVTSKNKLAEVDVMVVNEDHDILLLIEIEESPISPKTLLGDVFAGLLSTGFAATIGGKQTYFRITPQTQLWVAGYVVSKKLEKLDLIHQIQEKINEWITENEGKSINKVNLIIENELSLCLEALQKLCLEYLISR